MVIFVNMLCPCDNSLKEEKKKKKNWHVREPEVMALCNILEIMYYEIKTKPVFIYSCYHDCKINFKVQLN